MSSSNLLLSSYQLPSLSLANRVVIAPLTRRRTRAEQILNNLITEDDRKAAQRALDGLAFGFHELSDPITLADFPTH